MAACSSWKCTSHFTFIMVTLLLNCGIVVAGTVGVQHPKTIHKSRKPSTNRGVCASLSLDKVFTKKTSVDQQLLRQIQLVSGDASFSNMDKQHRLKIIASVQREINETVSLIYDSVSNMKGLLYGKNKSVTQLKENCKRRLTRLRTAMVAAEDIWNILTEAEKEEQSVQDTINKKLPKPRNVLQKFMGQLLGDISLAADKLESSLDDDAFENELHSEKRFSVETVLKVGGEKSTGEDNEGIVMLVDSESNHFVLSKPKDGTTTHVDHVLLKEIIFLTTLSFVLIVVCNYLSIPSLFGCIVTGVLLGPSGGNYLTSVVQIETIGEFGVFFMLFSVGLEFSPEKLRKVLRESLVSVFGFFACFLLIGLILGSMFGFLPRQSIFVTICLAFSSTPLITKLLSSYKPNKDFVSGSGTTNDDYVHLLVAMLVIEDGLLSIFMAVLPIIAGHSVEKSHSFAHVPTGSLHEMFHGTFGGSFEELFFTVFELVFGMAGIFFLAYVISKYVAARFFRSLNMSSPESYVLGVMSSIFLMLMVTEYFGISMEMGCFICGGIMGNMGEQITKPVTAIIDPFKDFFSSLFFASIGFHVFPSFVLSELAIFVPITTLVVFVKFAVSSLVLHHALPSNNKSNKWLIATGLSQMSEFSFLLGSRARRFGLIGREVYLMILSVTMISFALSPLVWFIVHNGFWWSLRTLLQKFRP